MEKKKNIERQFFQCYDLHFLLLMVRHFCQYPVWLNENHSFYHTWTILYDFAQYSQLWSWNVSHIIPITKHDVDIRRRFLQNPARHSLHFSSISTCCHSLTLSPLYYTIASVTWRPLGEQKESGRGKSRELKWNAFALVHFSPNYHGAVELYCFLKHKVHLFVILQNWLHNDI